MPVQQAERVYNIAATRDSPSALRALTEGIVLEQRARTEAISRLSSTLESLRGVDGALHPSLQSTDRVEPPPSIGVYCLGNFRISVDGEAIGMWRALKPRTLFQYLVSHRDRPVPREVLVEALWPDPDTAPAGTALKVVVHRVRKILRSTGKQLEIQASDEGYRLLSPDLWVDVEEFERWCLLARGYEGQGRTADAAASYACAAALYHGDFLEDVLDEWAVVRRERLKDQYLLALSRLAEAAFASLKYEQCIEHCQQILIHDPCREQAYRVLMMCYARLGQRGRVQRWYEVCTQMLRGDLDLEPEPETRATYSQAMAFHVQSARSSKVPTVETLARNHRDTECR